MERTALRPLAWCAEAQASLPLQLWAAALGPPGHLYMTATWSGQQPTHAPSPEPLAGLSWNLSLQGEMGLP